MRTSRSLVAMSMVAAVLSCVGAASATTVEFIAAGGANPDPLGDLGLSTNYDVALPTGNGDHTWHIRNRADVDNQQVWLASSLVSGRQFTFGGGYTSTPPTPRKPVTAYVMPGANINMDVTVSSKRHGYVDIGEAYDATVYQTGGRIRGRVRVAIGRYNANSPDGVGRLVMSGTPGDGTTTNLNNTYTGTNRGTVFIGNDGGDGAVILNGGKLESATDGASDQGIGSLEIGQDYFRIGGSTGELRALGGVLNVNRYISMGRAGHMGDSTGQPFGTLDPGVTNPYYEPEATFAMSQDCDITASMLVMWTNNTNLELIIDSDRDFNYKPSTSNPYNGGNYYNAPGNLNRLKGDLIVTLNGYTPSLNEEWMVMSSRFGYDLAFANIPAGYQLQVRDGTYGGSASKDLYLIYVPEPATALLLGLGLLLVRRRR